MSKFLVVILAVLLVACADNNSEPKYGERSGLSANYRAYVQASIDEWRAGKHDTDETTDALERNCGIYGTLWDYRP